MTRAILSVALLVSTLALYGLGQKEGVPQEKPAEFSRHIVWGVAETSQTHFIPEARLQAEARTSLPVNPREIQEIESLVEASRQITHSHGSTAPCRRAYHNSTSTQPRPDAVPLTEYLKRFPVIGRGKVVEVVKGLGYYASEVQTLIYVELDEILECRNEPGFRAVVVGDVVSVAQRKGEITVDGEVLCNETDVTLDTPPVGAEVIVGGNPELSDLHFLGTGPVFRIEEGKIQPQPYSLLAERSPREYMEVRDLLRGNLVECKAEVTIHD